MAIAMTIGCAVRVAAATPVAERVLVSVQIDGEARGDRVVLVTGDEVWLDADTLCAARLCEPRGAFRVDDGVRYVRLASLGITYALDRESGTLSARIEPHDLDVTAIDLGRRRPREIEYLRSTSMFVNYAVTGGVAGGPTTTTTATAFTEAGVTAGDALVYSAATVTPDAAVRGLTNATWDLPSAMTSIVVGDGVVAPGVLGGGGILAGLHVRRDFGLDPYFVAQPSFTQAGVVTRPSTIEVYRDGQLVRRQPLPPGPFRVQDVVSTVGGEGRVVIRDAFGLVQQVVSSNLVAPRAALAAGLVQSGFSIGWIRRDMLSSSFGYGPPAGAVTHRIGITDRVTGMLHAELAQELVSSDAGALIVHGRRWIETAVAGSATRAGGGTAASLSAGWSTSAISAEVSVRATSARYATLQLAPADDRARLEGSIGVGGAPSRRLAVSARASALQLRDAGTRFSSGGLASVQLSGSWRGQLAGTLATEPSGRRLIGEITVSLAWSLGERTTGTATTGVAGRAGVAGAAISRAAAATDSVGYQAQVQVGEVSSGLAQVDAQHRYGRASVSARWLGSTPSAMFELSGGVVAIGGRIKATRPVQGGFALLRVPGAPNVRGYLDNRVIGRTDDEGDLIVPDLQPYYANRVRIDAGDLPLRYAPEAFERVVAPPRRGGVVVRMTPEPSAMVRGTIAVSDRGRPIDASFADLVIDGRAPVPIGRGGAFEVDALDAGTHHAAVELDGRVCGFVIDLASRHTGDAIIELGRVTCELEVTR